jgi:CPA1 family monovalent cation:H+ antiporter
MTFCVILVTLVLQGLTLPPLIRALGLSQTSGSNKEEQDARRKLLEAALAWLVDASAKSDKADVIVYKDLTRLYQNRLELLQDRGDHETDEAHKAHTTSRELRRDALRSLIKVERDTALNLRNNGKINDEVLRRIEYELDLSDTRLSARG